MVSLKKRLFSCAAAALFLFSAVPMGASAEEVSSSMTNKTVLVQRGEKEENPVLAALRAEAEQRIAAAESPADLVELPTELAASDLDIQTATAESADAPSYAADPSGPVMTKDGLVYMKNGVIDPSFSGLALYDNIWCFFTNGLWDTEFWGLQSYNGGDFLIANGYVNTQISGLCYVNGVWGYFSNGQLMSHCSYLVLYDGCWFLLKNGYVDTEFQGLTLYDNNLFLVADGRLVTEYTGLYQTPTPTTWLYLTHGMVRIDYIGLVDYDGATFYIEDGICDTNYVGYCKQNGVWFSIINAQLDTTSPQYHTLVLAQNYLQRNRSEIEYALNYMNQCRRDAGIAPLTLDWDICLASAIHATEMQEGQYFSFLRPDGSDFESLFDLLHLDWHGSHNSVSSGYPNAAALCDVWKRGGPFQSSIVDPTYLRVGLALANNGGSYRGGHMWTTVLMY